MPLISVLLVEGREAEAKRAFMNAVVEAAERHLGAPPSSIRVVIQEVPPEAFAVGYQTKAEMAAASGEP